MYFAIGGLEKWRYELFKKHDVQKVLVSFADVKSREHIKLPFSEVMMDSGAFHAGTHAAKVTINAYSLWLELYLGNYPQIKHYINLDVMNDVAESRKNFAIMKSHGLSPIPVYHYGEPDEVLRKMCSEHEYIGLGGLAIGTIPALRLQQFWDRIAMTYPDNKFHVLGVGGMTPFINYQPYSVDSTSWIPRHGELLGYKNGFPGQLRPRFEGFDCFLSNEALFDNNIRAMLDWSRLEWTNHKRCQRSEAIKQQVLF